MSYINRMPTYNELVEMSNGELTRRINMSLSILQAAATRGEETTEKERVYRAYQAERSKRLRLGRTFNFNKSLGG